MRSNLNANRARKMRLVGGNTFGALRVALAGTYVILDDGPMIHALDANGANRNVVLPARHPLGGQLFLISNLSGGFGLNVLDSVGGAVVTIGPNSDAFIFSTMLTWRFLTQGGGTAAQFFLEPPVVVGSSAVVAAGDSGVIINRVAPVATAITLPAVAARAGFPVRIVDWSTGIIAQHTITITPNGAETIMRQPSWTMISNAGGGLSGMTLWPSTTLSGWYLAP